MPHPQHHFLRISIPLNLLDNNYVDFFKLMLFLMLQLDSFSDSMLSTKLANVELTRQIYSD